MGHAKKVNMTIYLIYNHISSYLYDPLLKKQKGRFLKIKKTSFIIALHLSGH